MSSQFDERVSLDSRTGGGGYNHRDLSQQTRLDFPADVSNDNPNLPRQRPLGPVVEEEKNNYTGQTKSSTEVGTGRDLDQIKDLAIREKPRANGSTGGKPATSRICKKCGESLTGQFVRALGGTFHLDCFKCQVSRMDLPPNPRLLTLPLYE